ncbi:sigma-54-dependent transcriptional regulator [Mucilaginibacter aquaedulcis]|uniref:sigma-54-dependent transcriptional regulator n=1 Tax=Mucilaginibacter aquaedulcis TaxID=1187081 RepID=UPI0025B3B0BE|nr:sigma-54 dependent transcriptional regulator [Mucilaginibacter aquaedulcis]MDN3547695.1 sigma-54 dependent transcriptional regulator [Mucilaginibacter aquaedulcis]
MKTNILIIDDEVKLSGLLARIIEFEGYRVLQASNAKAGLRLLETEDVMVVLCDVKLPDMNGVELVSRIKELQPHIEVINITAFGNIHDSVKAIKNGAFDYLMKGDDNEKIIPLLSMAVDKASLSHKVLQLEKRINSKYSFLNIIGKSEAILRSVELAKKVSNTPTTILLLGETGTGKEVFAQAIHQESEYRSKSFVAVNCSAFSHELLESELFGHKAGAFTGALKERKGLFEEANGGTIFLDEIGEMTLDLQAKLLRVLENGTFNKVGDSQTTKVKVRVLAATNRDLKKESETGHFRLDLYYRLSVFTIQLPPLRERRGDIPIIAKHFMKEFALKINRKINGMDDLFLKIINEHSWKGNIRELKNVMERVIILSNSEILTADLLPLEFFKEEDDRTEAMDLETIERLHICKVLHHCKGNKTETANLLGIGIATLYRKIEHYEINLQKLVLLSV